MRRKHYTFSIGSLFTLLIIYFMYLYSRDQTGFGWGLMEFITKWYLIIVIGIFLLGFLVYLIISTVIFLFFLYAKFCHKGVVKKPRIFDADFRLKKRKKPKL